MTKPIVAAQMYTCRDYCKTPAEIAESVAKVARIGYRAIQSSGMGREEPIEPAELRRICDGEGVTICATHISFDSMRQDLQKVIDDHLTMGCRYAGIGGAPKDARENEQTWSAFAREASEIGARLLESGISFIYHNHSHEFATYGSRTAMQIMFEDSDPNTFFFEPDTYWVQHGGASPVAWLEKLADRCPVVHLKDFAILPDRTQFFTEIGNGNLDWPGILEAAENAGTEFMPVEQDRCPGDPFDSLKISYDNLAAWGYR